MFLRFSKGHYEKDKKEFIRTIRKCVLLNGSVVMEYGNQIVGIAKLHEETDKCMDYDIVVAKQCELDSDKIARFIKDMIGKSEKFNENPSTKRRKYFVEEIDCDKLPIEAKIVFNRIV